MSEYRDDALDSIRLSDSTWLLTKSTNAIEVLRLTDSTELKLIIKHFDQFSLADSTAENSILNAYDHLTLSDNVSGQRISTSYVVDQIKWSDQSMLHRLDLTEDLIYLNDETVSRIASNAFDTLHLSEQVTAQRLATVHVNDRFKLIDFANSVQSEQLVDSILLGDFTQSKLYGTNYTIDTFVLGDADLSSVQLSNHAIDSVRFDDAVQTRLTARTDSQDYFSLYDQIKDSKDYGQAWTANTDTWAMSRYMPYAFDGLAVINQKLYGWNAKGVFLMEAPSRSINGFIQTGKIDFGEGLVHPTAAFLEYEMAGEDNQLDISVTTTQSGQPLTYTYMLPNKLANHLTNGRVLFGRGLRGRHFSFGISIAAQSAKINSLSLEFTKTARRI